MNRIATTAAALAATALALTACDTSSLNAETKNDTPTVVKEGAPFTHDNFKVKPGWKLTKDQFGGYAGVKGLTVTNTGGNQRTALFTLRLYKGKSVLAEIECDSNEMQKGEVSKLDCSSTDKLPKSYSAIKIADMF